MKYRLPDVMMPVEKRGQHENVLGYFLWPLYRLFQVVTVTSAVVWWVGIAIFLLVVCL